MSSHDSNELGRLLAKSVQDTFAREYERVASKGFSYCDLYSPAVVAAYTPWWRRALRWVMRLA
jgi:hypothetical protein